MKRFKQTIRFRLTVQDAPLKQSELFPARFFTTPCGHTQVDRQTALDGKTDIVCAACGRRINVE